MTLSEFKAWFEGFTEDMDGAPSAKQFEKIKAKVGEINDRPIERQVFIEKYREYFPRPWWQERATVRPFNHSLSAGLVDAALDSVGSVKFSLNEVKEATGNREQWSPHSAMYALGKAEYAA